MSAILDRPEAIAKRKPLPMWPDAWYVVARSSDISRGKIFDGRIADSPFVIFRTETRRLVALDAYCPHMGAHLRSGKVVGEKLQCSLHHFEIDSEGTAHEQSDCATGQSRAWPVAERFGLVFLFAGRGTPPNLPCPEAFDEYAWITGPPIVLKSDWRAMIVNGFDILHMRTIHQRALVAPPTFSYPNDGAIHFNYTTHVLPGGGLSSWVMKHLSNNRIHVHQTCYGTIMLAESNLGKIKSSVIFGFTQEGDKVRAFNACGTLRHGLFWRLRLVLTRWFFFSFLRKDYAIIEDMRLIVDGIDDPGVRAISDYLRSLAALR